MVLSGFEGTGMPANDDGSVGPLALGFSMDFFGSTFTSLCLNNNDNVTFTQPLSTYRPFGITGGTTPMIAPFFADVDTRAGNNTGNVAVLPPVDDPVGVPEPGTMLLLASGLLGLALTARRRREELQA